MEPERTTTTGDSLPVTHMRAFQMMSADEMIIPGAMGEGREGEEQKRAARVGVHHAMAGLTAALQQVPWLILHVNVSPIAGVCSWWSGREEAG